MLIHKHCILRETPKYVPFINDLELPHEILAAMKTKCIGNKVADRDVARDDLLNIHPKGKIFLQSQ